MRYLFFIAFSLGVLLTPTSSFAHGSGPPFALVNGEYMQSNPILGIAQPISFILGSDAASSSGYLVGQEIVFDIDEQFFPNPYAQAQSPFGLPVVNQNAPSPAFRWNPADGASKEEGKTIRHAYTKPGTYIVELEAKFPGKTDEYTVGNTIQLDVLPDVSYERPIAKIAVNGKSVADPARDTVAIKPMSQLTFDASESTGKIKQYLWDFGDGKGAEGKTVTHRYSRDEYFPVAVLRVIDENNIVSDTYVLLDMPFDKPNPILGIWYAVSDFFVRLFNRE